MQFKNILEIENHFKLIARDLPNQCKSGDPWVFLTASAFIEYLAKLVRGYNGGSSGYMNFIRIWMPEKYRNFTYINQKKDLPEQMYYILRCGIVHSFSFIPDNQSKERGGRDRAIVLTHRKNNDGLHLINYRGNNGNYDSALFVAEDFVNDIIDTLEEVFNKAKTDKGLKNNIIQWVERHPPIAGI